MFTLEFVGYMMVLGMYVAAAAAFGTCAGWWGMEWWQRRRLWRWPTKPKWYRRKGR